MEDVLDDIINVAKAVAPLVPGGGQAVLAAEAVINLIDKISGKTETRSLDQVRGDLADKLAAMNAHADSTIDKLRGD